MESSSSLARLSQDLFNTLEEDLSGNREKVIDDFMEITMKRDEMNFSLENPTYYEKLRRVLKNDFLPRYNKYSVRKEEIEAKKEKRSLVKYVVGTVLALEILETILTRGKSLSPQILIPSGIFEGFLGGFLYYATNTLDNHKIARARERLFKDVSSLDKKLQIDREYYFRSELAGNVEGFQAEVSQLLSNYSSPEQFWEEYGEVRGVDPTSKTDIQKLTISNDFREFLNPHITGLCNEVARKQRFDNLYVAAQKYFVDTLGPKYTLREFERQDTNPGGIKENGITA